MPSRYIIAIATTNLRHGCKAIKYRHLFQGRTEILYGNNSDFDTQ